MGKYKRKTDRSLKVTTEVMDNANRRLHTGESKRSIAEDFRVAWINPEKEFEDSDSTDFSRSIQGYIYQCGTERVS